MSSTHIQLKPDPDGFGFIYGVVTGANGQTHRVDTMPPVSLWRGDVKLEDHGPHPTDWVIYLDGIEIARVRERADVETAVGDALRTPSV